MVSREEDSFTDSLPWLEGAGARSILCLNQKTFVTVLRHEFLQLWLGGSSRRSSLIPRDIDLL